MKTRTTLILLLITLGAGAWLLFKESGSAGDAGGHLLFDWSGSAEEQDADRLRVDVNATEVTGIDLKNSTVEVSLRREADGTWALTKGVQDRADGALVKLLLDYLGVAKISDVIDSGEVKDGKVSESSLGLDDTGAWRVTWLGPDNKVLAEIRAGKTAPLGGAGYVQVAGQKSRPDIYLVKPDLRPLLARPLDSFRDPKACRYPEEQVQKFVVRKGEGEVELSRSMIPRAQPPAKDSDGKPIPGPQKVVLEPGEWVITRPLANAPAEQKIAHEFISEICGLKVKDWLPYTETTDKPLVEITVFPPVKGSKGTTLSFFPDPSAPEATAICRDAQRKAAFKVDKETVDYFALADSPNPFRSRKLPAMVDPSIMSTVEVRTPQDSVTLVRVGNKWSWRPLNGGPWADAAVEQLEKLITAMTDFEVLDFASDSLTDPKVFALDQPDYIITFAVGKNESLDKLTPIGVKGPDGRVVASRDESTPLEQRNYRTLRIAIRQDGHIFANYAGDPFVYRVGPELPSAVPLTYNKWRTLALPGFNMAEVLSIKRSIGTTPPLEMKQDLVGNWTVMQGGTDVTPIYATPAIRNLVNKLGTLNVASWLDKPEEAEKALATPAVTIEIQHKVYGEKAADIKVVTTTLSLAPMAAPNAPMCYGKHSASPMPFLIRTETLREATADLLMKR